MRHRMPDEMSGYLQMSDKMSEILPKNTGKQAYKSEILSSRIPDSMLNQMSEYFRQNDKESSARQNVRYFLEYILNM